MLYDSLNEVGQIVAARDTPTLCSISRVKKKKKKERERMREDFSPKMKVGNAEVNHGGDKSGDF